ncbi:hypothetical protein ASPCAL02223 [Aspergillus calidoustus]|uniref:Uncharacterized protein n=1 Tax=Aspergillus calidoustus TaxID=454130 RepID=A0A0U5GL29_ASPCI|nr:hypothetical protein ASPCAL02223 [Aspergillus calidoustus]
MASDIKTVSSSGTSDPLPSDSASQPETSTSHPASMPTPASTSNTTSETQHQHRDPPSLYQGLSANFAHDPKTPFTVNYDQEVYLQLMAGEDGARAGEGADAKRKLSKTPTQIYREEWVRRALNPAISDPRGDPSPNDFECAESQRERDRF